MVDIIPGCLPWLIQGSPGGMSERQEQATVLRKWKKHTMNRSCRYLSKASTGGNAYSNLRKITIPNNRHAIGDISKISSDITKNRVKRFTRYSRVFCYEPGDRGCLSDGLCSDDIQEKARSSLLNNASSSLAAESKPGNCYPQAGLEVVKALEEAEAEVLQAILNQDRHLESFRSPGYDDLPVVTCREPSNRALVSESLNGDLPLRGENSLHFDISRKESVREEDPGASVDENTENILSRKQKVVSSPDAEPITVLAVPAGQDRNMLEQVREILVFAGPALGIWLSGPIMSLIDTSVIGTGSSLELAALGPGTVLCDQLSYIFMFLSVATSNLIATSLAQKDQAEAASHLSRLLFVSLGCGLGMLLFTEVSTTTLLHAFVGPKNSSLVPAARTYVKIRGLAWPAVLVGLVAQSASFGMQDSWSPLKVLAVASLVNLFGDILLCTFLGYGIAGAAWATMASQYVAAILMLVSLGKKGYNVLALRIPTVGDLVHMVELAAPVLLTMLSKVSFYTLVTYLATSLGATTLAAHQVMIGIYSLCNVWGEPLAQTAQSFMPGLIRGPNRNIRQAQVLLDSLLVIGVLVGFVLGIFGISIPWIIPQIFSKDLEIVAQMRRVTIPFFCCTLVTAPTLSLEGTLLASRDLRFLGLSMATCFCFGSILLLTFNKLGFGLLGSWWTLSLFQTARFLQSYSRLKSPASLLYKDTSSANHVPWEAS